MEDVTQELALSTQSSKNKTQTNKRTQSKQRLCREGTGQNQQETSHAVLESAKRHQLIGAASVTLASVKRIY